MVICCGEQCCQTLSEALCREWLETNGTGGYASSTIINCHTRKYHGLLIAHLDHPAGRYVLLSKLDDSVYAEGKEFLLSAHKYPGALVPREYHHFHEFRQNLYPEFIYHMGNVVLRKSLMMPHGINAVLLSYTLEKSPTPFILRLKPLLAFRGIHEQTHENSYIQAECLSDDVPHGFRIRPYAGMPELFFQANRCCAFHAQPLWYRNFEFTAEAERGYGSHEDLFHPGTMEVSLSSGDTVLIGIGTGAWPDLSGMWDAEINRRLSLQKNPGKSRAASSPAKKTTAAGLDLTELCDHFIRSGRTFLFHNPDGRPAIIAGYHWFGDWGRDTLISLPGLTFCAGRTEEGIAILRSMVGAEHNGLLPNFFGPQGKNNAYNSVDAALWFFWAVQEMIRYTGRYDDVHSHLWPSMKRIIQSFMEGTDFDIFMNPRGLLHAGNATTQLTWMDACVNGMPVTPRHGYAVEINALWYNALCCTHELAIHFGERQLNYEAMINTLQQAFRDTFWLDNESYLADVVHDEGVDSSLRPNQIFAVSLPFSPLTIDQSVAVVEKVRADLLTPFGLRTLSPRDKAYRGQYGGDGISRDGAYHQGTVWPWLLGHFGEACFKVSASPSHTAKSLLTTLTPLLTSHLTEQGLGHISEVFDGDPPHRPAGCIAQAWNTAEILRLILLVRDHLSGPSSLRKKNERKTR